MRDFSKKEASELKRDIDSFVNKYQISLSDFMQLFGHNQIPVTIFRSKLSPLETIVTYLKVNQHRTLTEIARILNKQRPSVWLAHKNAKLRKPRLPIYPTRYNIPIKTFNSDKLSILECVSVYLREHHKLTYRQIGHILKRDERTIWTACHRAEVKNES